MKERITRIARSLFELETGILMYGIAGTVIILFFPARVQWLAAWWLGIATAVICAIDMWWALDRGLALGERVATKKVAVHYMLRYLFVAIVLIAGSVTGWCNPLVVFAGIMGLKAGAYLNRPAKIISTKIYGREILPELIEIPEDER